MPKMFSVTLLYTGTIFTSAFLLFLVQPLIAKQILPWFGGSAAVWTVCMVFFQLVLLLGYAYSDFISRHLSPRRQVFVHCLLLLASLAFLPIIPADQWKALGATADPTFEILLLLFSTIGLSYFILATTGPLIQSWVTHIIASAHVYRFFSLSNLASLAALMSYPLLIEPNLATATQAWIWSAIFILFVLLCAGAALYFAHHAHALPPTLHLQKHLPEGDWDPGINDHLLWIALSALGSWLLLAITNHITQNIAPIPFLWVLPLTLYLLTFVFCFENDRWYRRQYVLAPLALLLVAAAWGLQSPLVLLNLKVALPLFTIGLFVFCMFLHGELAQMRPGPRHLTRFYLMVSLGGALGGLLVGVVAPKVLPAYYELGVGLVITALLAVLVLRNGPRFLPISAAVAAMLCALFLYLQIHRDLVETRELRRNFYGTLHTLDTSMPDLKDNARCLFHGTIKHGEQFLAPGRRQEPTAYYTAGTGIVLALNHRPMAPAPIRVGVLGLGIGTVATYGRPGDVFRFYELNPQVIELAHQEFSFLKDSQARVEVVPGDARLSLEQEAPQGFDVLAVDAFSGDSVPVHLITHEAMGVYLKHIGPKGIIGFHITNRFLRLAPVVQLFALARGLHYVYIHSMVPDRPWDNTEWVLVARDPAVFMDPAIQRAASPIAPATGLSLWTDDFNNLFQVVR